jgi:sulfopyruvate decarboxylase TPP-binding subunit
LDHLGQTHSVKERNAMEGEQVAQTLRRIGVTDVVWLPDSALGPWEGALEQAFALRRVCREGEAWVLAAGLYLGGRKPLVMIQSTGFFESGDALRNVLFDLRLPLFALIGYRGALASSSPDTARDYLEPVLRAWGIDYIVLDESRHLSDLEAHFRQCEAQIQPGAALLPEGRM